MADGFIQVPVDSTGKKIDTEELAVGANTVERHRNRVAGALAAALADVLNTPATGAEYGLLIRNVPGDLIGTSGALNALNAAVSTALADNPSAGFAFTVTAAYTGTLVAELSYDGGATWSPTRFLDYAGMASSPPTERISLVFAAQAAAVLQYGIVTLAGATHARARVSVFTSGTATGICRATDSMNIAPPHRVATYTAIYRLAARPYAISKLFTAGSRFQFATLHHAAAAVKLIKVRRVLVALESSSVAGITMADLVRITTAPATGNPAITPGKHSSLDSAAEATAFTLPTTAATEADLFASIEWNLGITGAASTVNPPPPLTYQELYSDTNDLGPGGECRPILIRPGVLEGVAVTLDCNAAATVKGFVIIRFTEE